MSEDARSMPPPVLPDTDVTQVAARAYVKAVGLFLLISFPALTLFMLVPDWSQPFHSLGLVIIFVVSMAAGGRWQRLRSGRQWATYVTLAVVAWIATLLLLGAVTVAVVSLFFGL
jgi:hypothetical protein